MKNHNPVLFEDTSTIVSVETQTEKEDFVLEGTVQVHNIDTNVVHKMLFIRWKVTLNSTLYFVDETEAVIENSNFYVSRKHIFNIPFYNISSVLAKTVQNICLNKRWLQIFIVII